MASTNEMTRIVDLLDRAGNGDAWHGPPVDATLAGVTGAQAAEHPIPNGHCIWELALHIAVWERVVARRFAGEVLEPTSAEDWPGPQVEIGGGTYTVVGTIPRGERGRQAPQPGAALAADAIEKEWQRAVADVRASRAELRAAMLAFDPSRLSETVRGKNYSYYVMAHGIVQHDLYHAGQIALLKKAAS